MLTFIDLFAGIGGTRLAFEAAGGRCIFSSEWDKYACVTYRANFGETPWGDIREIPSTAIPHHDVLVAGFPCQPFSIAGVSKNGSLGRGHGFHHRTQGTLFFEIARILHDLRPPAFLLENVKNLAYHDGGRTLAVIEGTLRELGYSVHRAVIDASAVVPQHRERVYIVGFRGGAASTFTFPSFPVTRPPLSRLLEAEPPEKYLLSRHLWDYLQDYARKHRQRGNGFGYGLVADPDTAVTRTLSARYYKDGSEILIPTPCGRPRRLTPRECARLMGFPDSFKIPVSDTQAYKQFGNSVVVPVVRKIASAIADTLKKRESVEYDKGRRPQKNGAHQSHGQPADQAKLLGAPAQVAPRPLKNVPMARIR